MNHISITRTELGELSDVAALKSLIEIKGLHGIDIGCGPGDTTRKLCALGATMLGVEPDPIQAEKNRQAAPMPGLKFVEARAEALPTANSSHDAVFFFRSLHHVPAAHMDGALQEALRVLKPGQGTLFVVEPAMDGTYFPINRPFHDETEVRTQAQAALRRFEAQHKLPVSYYRYVQYRRFESFEQFVDNVTGKTFNDTRREAVETETVRAAFETGRVTDGGYVFEQPILLNIYKLTA